MSSLMEETFLINILIKNNIKAYENIRKILLVKEITTQLVVYEIIHTYYKLIVIDLNKERALDADPKAINQVHFSGNLDRAGDK